MDFIEDENVLRKLMEIVEFWAVQNNTKNIHGPLGFSDFDASGILVEGFDELPTSCGKYNFPYYSELIEKIGYKKDIDWVEYNIKVPKSVPEKYAKTAMFVKERHKLHSAHLRKKKDLLKYSDEVFQLLNQEYNSLYAFSELTKAQCEDLKKQFIPLLRLKYISIILNSDDKVIGFGICMPSISKALQKSKGSLYPFGILRILIALQKNDTIDTLLIAIHKDYKDKGINAIIFNDIGNSIIKSGITNIESTRELEENINIQNLWNKFEFRQHKKARCYVKKLE
ncbi:MAG: N-acetyltransferase [Bacteroidales bacterium]